MTSIHTHTPLSGWGRTIIEKSILLRPEFIDDAQNILQQTSSCIARGCGRSYGDLAMNAQGVTIQTTRLNRLLSFDPEKAELICEAGVILRDIQRVFLPRGYALITSPGTAEVTVGGAIANDAHGKNHDRVGSFGDHVVWIELLSSSGEMIHCSEQNNAQLFFATIGGLGLTGLMTRVCVRLQKQSNAVLVKNELITDMPAFLARFQNLRDSATYSVAWLDMTSLRHFCRGILSTAEPHPDAAAFSDQKPKALPPFCHWFLRDTTIRLHNQWHYLVASRKSKMQIQNLMHYLYPLDGLRNWNRLYGRRGFYQFQCVIPENAAHAGILEIAKIVLNSPEKPYLAVLKTLGGEGRGLLSFPMRGFTLAMDFPNKQNTVKLLQTLEDVTTAHGGRIYFAKDACMRPEHLEIMYPKIHLFRDVIKIYDEKKYWQSRLSKRLGI